MLSTPPQGPFRFSEIFIFIACVALFSIEAVLAQCWHGDAFRYISPQLVVLDVLVACALVLSPKRLAQLAALFQLFLSLFIFSYVFALRTLPTLTTLVNGFHLLAEADGLLAYAYLPLLPVLLLSCALKLFLLEKIRLPPLRLRAGLMALVFILWSGWLAIRWVSGDFAFQSKPRDFRNPMVREIQHVGYLTAWAVEGLQGKPAEARSIFEQTTCSGEAVSSLPVFSLGPRIHMFQVESLDYAALSAQVGGRVVAPALAALSSKALLLEMDGTKNLGSANSDYELLNTKVAEKQVLYYTYLVDFPDSVMWTLQRHGYATAVFHGLTGRYMSLRQVYPRMGFSKLYFREELQSAGYKIYPDLFMGQVPDGPLLEFAAAHARAAFGPFLHFIITVTMHENPPPEFVGAFPGHAYWNVLSYFDKALGDYVEGLEAGETVILYGDHQSYNGPERSGTVPFLIYTHGENLSRPLPSPAVYSRCEVSHYLRALFEASL